MGHTLRVVLDTNVLLSGIAYPGSLPGKILTAWRHGSLDVLLSPFILDELRRVLPRLANRHGLTPAEMDDLVDVHILPWLSANSNAVLVYNNYGYNDRSEVKSSGRYALLNANVVVNTARFLKGDFIISGYNLLDSNPLIPMPTAPGTGTNMVPIAGRNYSLSYRLVF